jgi:hypothetical protein
MTTQETESQSIRIRASHIRHKLLSRNGSAHFRKVLSEMSDAELVRRDDENHARKLAWFTEQKGQTKLCGRI